uniref:Transposase Tnp1/En/Spm-like domain-containing protein n=1 Tax=Zea mays TaxID=4577 RepID=A0A804UJZ0_MAIZE
MARGGKQRITRSHDEYLSEDHIGEKSPQKNAASSEQNISNKEDHLDSRSDNESQDITMSNNINGEDQLDGVDEVKEVKRRGKTKLINVWNIPRGHMVVVNCNELDQPIGEEAGVLAKFLGMVARNGSLCSLSFKDWRLLIGKKDRNHKQINKEAILNQVKGELKELLAQQPDLADSSNGKDAWEGDALNRILGKEKPGHIHGLGLVPNPKQVFDASTSSRMKHLNVTTLDETSSEDVVSLRLELEKLQKHVQKQDDTILDLQHTVERQKRQHGYPDAPLSPPTDVRPAMKRQGYLDAPLSPPTDVRPAMKRQEDENEDDEYEELHSHYKCSKIQDKSKPPHSRREALHASRVSASIKVSTDIFLKSTRYPNRKVALGIVLSQDPKTKVGDVALGKEFWMVRVSLVSVRDEPLIRPYNNFKVLGQVGNNPIAWPSSCIEKVN